MQQLSREFDRVMGGSSINTDRSRCFADEFGNADYASYIPEGRDPRWRLNEALGALGRATKHLAALEELPPHGDPEGDVELCAAIEAQASFILRTHTQSDDNPNQQEEA